jgi:hypothetical protein
MRLKLFPKKDLCCMKPYRAELVGVAGSGILQDEFAKREGIVA